MFDKTFDGMFYPVGFQGEINVGGQVLMWRPRELTEEATEEQRIAANRPREIAERDLRKGQIQGVTMDTTSSNVKAWNKIETSYERPIPVPD